MRPRGSCGGRAALAQAGPVLAVAAVLASVAPGLALGGDIGGDRGGDRGGDLGGDRDRGAGLARGSFWGPAAAEAEAGTDRDRRARRPLSWRIDAAPSEGYALSCRFTAVRVDGALVNTLEFEARGPRSGRIPTDNARCVLTKTVGAGAVVLAVTKDRPYLARVARPGEQARLMVW